MVFLNERTQVESNQLSTQTGFEHTADHDEVFAQKCWQDLGDQSNNGCLQSNTDNAPRDVTSTGLPVFDLIDNRFQIADGAKEVQPGYPNGTADAQSKENPDAQSNENPNAQSNENPNVRVATDGSNSVTVRNVQGNWQDLPKDANLDTVRVSAESVEYLRSDATRVTLNTRDGSEVTDVSGTKIHRAYPGAEPDRYESANGAILEKRGDKWWVKSKDDTEWNSAGGEIVTYRDGTVQYGGTGLCSTQDYNLGASRAFWIGFRGRLGAYVNDGKKVYCTQETTKSPLFDLLKGRGSSPRPSD